MLKIASYYFLLLMVFSSCNETHNNTEKNIVVDTTPIKNAVVDTSNKVAVKYNTPAALKEAEKLGEEINKNPNESLFNKLNILAYKSDGELATTIDVIIQTAFYDHFDLTFTYLFNNKQSHLYQALLDGCGEDLAVYTGNERIQKLSALKKESLKKAKKLNYSNDQIKYLTQLLDKIKPEIFD
ncbi:MAG: hypothetical protein H0W84_14735 [Bacteroidetes bacterium]|nr:hypothetical protein [Bacteroidota bacterium]